MLRAWAWFPVIRAHHDANGGSTPVNKTLDAESSQSYADFRPISVWALLYGRCSGSWRSLPASRARVHLKTAPVRSNMNSSDFNMAVGQTQILTLPEVAQLLRCSKAHLSNLLNGRVPGARPLPHVSVGRRKLIRRESLEHWLNDTETEKGW